MIIITNKRQARKIRKKSHGTCRKLLFYISLTVSFFLIIIFSLLFFYFPEESIETETSTPANTTHPTLSNVSENTFPSINTPTTMHASKSAINGFPMIADEPITDNTEKYNYYEKLFSFNFEAVILNTQETNITTFELLKEVQKKYSFKTGNISLPFQAWSEQLGHITRRKKREELSRDASQTKRTPGEYTTLRKWISMVKNFSNKQWFIPGNISSNNLYGTSQKKRIFTFGSYISIIDRFLFYNMIVSSQEFIGGFLTWKESSEFKQTVERSKGKWQIKDLKVAQFLVKLQSIIEVSLSRNFVQVRMDKYEFLDKFANEGKYSLFRRLDILEPLLLYYKAWPIFFMLDYDFENKSVSVKKEFSDFRNRKGNAEERLKESMSRFWGLEKDVMRFDETTGNVIEKAIAFLLKHTVHLESIAKFWNDG